MPVAGSKLLVNTTPIYVGAFSFLVWGERVGARFVAGALVALAGIALLFGADLGSVAAVRGDLLALIAALFYTGYLLLMKVVRGSEDASVALFLACVGATGALFTYALVRGDPFVGFPAHSWAALSLPTQVSIRMVWWSVRTT